MSSQDAVEKIVGQLTEWSLQEVKNNLNDVLPVLISSLQCMDQQAVTLKALQALVVSCLPCIPLSSVDEMLLKHVLPAIENLFKQALEGVTATLENGEIMPEEETLVSLTSLLQVCIELLNCLELILKYLESHSQVEVRNVPIFPKVIVAVLLESFKHCKESEKLYGHIFLITGESLSSLFKKTHEVQTHFYVLMQKNLQFNCTNQDDVNLLIEVLQIVGDIGEMVTGLGLKTMATLWKAYIFLTEQYIEHLRGALDIAAPLRFLSSSIVQSFSGIMTMDRVDIDLATRTLKVCSFELKVILKLCGLFTGVLGDCYCDLLHLLVTLHRYSLPYLQFKKLPADILKATESHHIVGMEPLLLNLMTEVVFIQEYFDNAQKFRNQPDECLGFLLLSVNILKELVKSEQSSRKLWMASDRSSNLLCEMFQIVDHCHEELCWEMYFPFMTHGGESMRATDLYEQILTCISVFIVTASKSEFPVIERLLLQNVLQSSEWRAMLAMDIWCILARYGSAELRFQHLCFLVDILKQFSPACYCPERVYLSRLVGRLFSLSSNEQMENMVKRLPPRQYPVIWGALGLKSVPENSTLIKHLLTLAVSCTTKFHASSMSLKVYDAMLSSLVGATAALETGDVTHMSLMDLTWNVVNLWKEMSPHIAVEEGSHWLNHFISVLCYITMHLVGRMDTAQLIQVVYKLKVIAMCASSSVKLALTSVLKSLAVKYIDVKQEGFIFCSNVGTIFGILLEDKNQLVCQATYEVFSYFAYMTRHEEIVTFSVSNNRNLQYQSALYFKKIPAHIVTGSGNYLEFNDFLKHQRKVKFNHTCTEKNCRSDRNMGISMSTALDMNFDQPVKKQKIENDIMQVIERIHKDTAIIVDYCMYKDLPLKARQELANIIKNLNTQM